MPLVGVVEPSHSELRRKDKVGYLPNWLPLDDVLEHIGSSIKWAPWTYELVSAMLDEHQERLERISVSSLVAHCPRAEVIKRKADYITALEDLYIPFRGTMVHRTMEMNRHPTSIAEARFYTTVDGIEFSCSPDLLDQEVLFDYKVTQTPPAYNYPYRHHTEQVEMNAFIARHAERWDLPERMDSLPFDPREHPVSHVAVVYLGPKWVKVLEVEKKEEVFLPTGKFAKVQVPFVWPDPYVLKVLRPRLHLFKNALDSYPEWPEPWTDMSNVGKDGKFTTYKAEDVWGGEPGWHCPGPPLCKLPDCVARRWPDRLTWVPSPRRKSKHDEDDDGEA
jgi:hypothetical protein